MQSATADAVIDAINEYIDAKTEANLPKDTPSLLRLNTAHKTAAVAQLDRAHDRLRHVLMTGIA